MDGTTTRKYGGTGLGLAICQRLASLLEGRIEVESEINKGTTFTLTIPMVISSRDKVRERISAAGSIRKWKEGTGLPRILVVEDNEIASEQIATALQDNGFAVDVAADGELALVKIGENIPDGIVLDLMMPRVDGFGVLDSIRSTPKQ